MNKLKALILLMIALPATAADLYVRAGAAAPGTGADWNTAFPSLPAVLVRGNTYYVADGSYPSYSFDDGASGTTLITIKKATVAAHGTSTGWLDAYGDGQAVWQAPLEFLSDYWLFDGVTRNESDWFSGTAYGFVIDDSDDVQIEERGRTSIDNITIRYTYLKARNTSPGSGLDIGRRHIFLDRQGAPGTGFANWTISRNFFQYGNVCMQVREAAGLIVEYNAFADNWSTQPNNHGENVSAYYGGNSGQIYRFNQSRNMIGTAAWAVNNANNWQVYGNTYSDCEYGNGFVGFDGGTSTGFVIYNETIIRPRFYTRQISLASGSSVQNCIFMMGTLGSPSFTGCTLATCAFSGATGQGTSPQVNFPTSAFINYAGNDFRLSVATTAGTVLASPFNTDMRGVTRGADGVFDRGAFEFAAGGGGPGDTNAPVVTLTAPTNNAVISNIFSVTATGTDAVGVSAVEFYIAGSQVGSDPSSPYAYSWDTTAFANGNYLVFARGYDAAGNYGYSGTNTIHVTNTVTLPTPAVYWPFTEGTGSTATDTIAGNVLNATNGATWVTGRFNSGAGLDGVNDHWRAPNSVSLNIGDSTFSVACWVRMTNNANAPFQQIAAKVKEVGAFTTPFYAWHVFLNQVTTTTYRPMFQVINSLGASVNIASSAVVNYGDWVHLCGVYDGAAVKIYVNGALQGTAAQTGNVIQYTQPFYVGSTGLPGEYGRGAIDELRLYGEALTANQVALLYEFTPVETVPPTILIPPVNMRLINNQSSNLTVVASGTPTLHYQWRRNGVNVGSDSASHTVSGYANAGTYDVVVSNGAGSATSASALVEVIVPPVVLAVPFTRTNALVGTQILISPTLSNYIYLVYMKDGVIIPGITNQALLNGYLQESGLYTVAITNEAGGTVSDGMRVLIYQGSMNVGLARITNGIVRPL